MLRDALRDKARDFLRFNALDESPLTATSAAAKTICI